MDDNTLEKIDILRKRTGVTYKEANEALIACDGNVVDALIYIEELDKQEQQYTTKEEFLDFIKGLIKKGNVNRIKIKKDDKVIIDIPVNAGITAGAIGLIYPPILAVLAISTVAAVFTKFTIEITKTDGSVEIVNKYVKSTVNNVKEKVEDLTKDIKDKFKNKSQDKEENFYSYTVDFEDENKDEDK